MFTVVRGAGGTQNVTGHQLDDEDRAVTGTSKFSCVSYSFPLRRKTAERIHSDRHGDFC